MNAAGEKGRRVEGISGLNVTLGYCLGNVAVAWMFRGQACHFIAGPPGDSLSWSVLGICSGSSERKRLSGWHMPGLGCIATGRGKR